MLILLLTLIISDTTYILSPIYVKGKRPQFLGEKFPMTYDVSGLQFSSKSISLLTSPGVYPRTYTNMTGLSIRGSSMEEIKVLFEGIPIKSPQNGYFDVNLIPSDLIGGFETLLTGNSSYFGYDAMAGLVNIRLTDEVNTIRAGMGREFFSIATILGFFASKNLFIKSGFAWETTPESYETNSENRSIEVKNSGRQNLFGFTKIIHSRFTFLLAAGHSMRGIPIIPGGLTHTPDSIFEQIYIGNFKTGFTDFSFMIDKFRYKPSGREEDEHLTGRFELNISPVKFFNFRTFLEGIRSNSLKDHSRYGVSIAFNYSEKAGYIFPFVSISADYWLNQNSFKPSFFAGITLDPGIYTSFSTGYRLPTFNDLYWPRTAYAEGNPDLRTENLEEFEFGFKKTTYHTKFNLALFFRRYNDLIKWAPADRGIWTPINLENVRIRGVDGKFEYKVGSFSVSLGGEYIDTVISRLNLIYYPMHSLNFSVGWGKYKLSVVRLGERYERLTGPKTMPPVTLLNLQLGFTVGTGSILLEVTNLTNQSYSLIRGYPAPGREWKIKVETKI